VDAAITLCTDQPVASVAAVNDALGLAGLRPDVALRATHKGLMRDAFAEAGAPSPRYRRVVGLEEAGNSAEEIGFPLIVKPVTRSGSQGVSRVTDAAGLEDAVGHASSFSIGEAEMILEEYVDGPEVSVETVSFAGMHHVIAITDKRTSGHPHHVEMGHVEPSQLSPDTQDAIRGTAIEGLEALGVMGSTAHVEIKVGSEGPRLIEIGARLGGDHIATELVLRSTGVNMVRAAIELALQRTPDIRHRHIRGAAIRYLSAEPGLLSRVRGLHDAYRVRGVERIELTVSPGEYVRPIAASQDRPGYVLAEGDDAASAEAAVVQASQLVELITRLRAGDASE
jgi:biotin carboxylase